MEDNKTSCQLTDIDTCFTVEKLSQEQIDYLETKGFKVRCDCEKYDRIVKPFPDKWYLVTNIHRIDNESPYLLEVHYSFKLHNNIGSKGYTLIYLGYQILDTKDAVLNPIIFRRLFRYDKGYPFDIVVN